MKKRKKFELAESYPTRERACGALGRAMECPNACDGGAPRSSEKFWCPRVRRLAPAEPEDFDYVEEG